MALRIVAHGHFYQPPREDPWTGEIDVQPDAAPARDWNERVFQECYGPNTAVRIPTPEGDKVVNNFERLSFNVGPTLMAWLEKAHRNAYLRIIEADRQSVQRLGHGNAMAQAFHHTILPLASVRDMRTQVRWGLADFAFRFGRRAEGMWLPETAVNDATLAVLIEEGVAFTVLAPHQAAAWKADSEESWHSNAAEPLDTRVAYRYEHPDGSGRSIAVFLYDGELARGIAFENLGSSADRYLAAFAERHSGDEMHVVHAATDGETYGHHHKFSDLGLAFALFVEIHNQKLEATNYAAFLAEHPPRHEIRLPKEPTSWSCAHGVGRWMDDCGCSTYGPEGWHQKWRGPLRAGLEVIRWAVDETYERFASPIFVDPWGARDRYVSVVIGEESWERFVEGETAGINNPEIQDRAHLLLEMQRNSMQMFTSCGWFFYDVSRIETTQILRYAARTLDLLEELGLPLPKDAYMPILGEAASNDPDEGTAASIIERLLEERTANA